MVHGGDNNKANDKIEDVIKKSGDFLLNGLLKDAQDEDDMKKKASNMGMAISYVQTR